MRQTKDPRSSAAALMTALFLLGTGGCLSTPELETPDPYDYDNTAILITNPDWGVIPLPNDFLNPVRQAAFVVIPGAPEPAAKPVGMALPIVDETAAAVAQGLGYDVVEDSDLTKTLVTGMNRLDGWVTSFAPKIPFSRLPDPDSIVPFDGTNGDTANLFLLDITDPGAVSVVTPDKYYRVVNWERRTQYPYYLSLRFAPAGPFQAPADFLPARTYAIVVTGIDETTGIKAFVPAVDGPATEKEPVQPENTFLVFAAPDAECPDTGECMFSAHDDATDTDVGLTYITKLGNPVNSVLTGLEAIQEAEGARQITDWVLTLWEELDTVAGVRERTEVVAAFQWTTVSNPMPAFFDAAAALMGGNPVLPSPADYISGGTVQKAMSGCNPSIGFTFKTAVAEDTVNTDTVKLYAVGGDTTKTLTEIGITVTPSTTGGVTGVVVKPSSALSPATQYAVVATNGIMNVAKTRTAVDETYFGLTRAALADTNAEGDVTGFIDTPLVSDDGQGSRTWNSPNLDSRLDTLILNHCLENGIDPVAAPIVDVTQEKLDEAKDGGFGVMKVLESLEALRTIYKPIFDSVVLDAGLVEAREDIVIGWTFTTGACN